MQLVSFDFSYLLGLLTPLVFLETPGFLENQRSSPLTHRSSFYRALASELLNSSNCYLFLKYAQNLRRCLSQFLPRIQPSMIDRSMQPSMIDRSTLTLMCISLESMLHQRFLKLIHVNDNVISFNPKLIITFKINYDFKINF